MIETFLQEVIPFRFLDRQQRAALLADLTEETFAAGEVLSRQGDERDSRVFLLLEGAVEAVDRGSGPATRVTVIEAGHYFGERAALFDTPRLLELRALVPSRCQTMPGERFLQLIETSSPFAQALGNILRVKQGIFQAFDRFLAEAQHGVAGGEITLRQLVPLYRALQPALHPLAEDPRAIDFAALAYAVRRLPDNVTRTYLLFLTDNLPALYSQPDQTFQAAPSPARRRSAYEMTAGKDLVLLRDGLTDLIDLLTCLCLYAVEARKLRKRLHSSSYLVALQQHLSSPPAGGSDDDFLTSLPFSASEVQQLRRVWPEDPAGRLYEIALHHEDLVIQVRKQLDNYNNAHSEMWVAQIAHGVRELLGCDPSELPGEVAVHVISSNTHSVTNCLSPFLAQRAERILTWGERARPDLAGEPWDRRADLLYALARYYLDAHPDEAAAQRQAQRACGVLRLVETAFTGIQVELIDTAALAGRAIDPEVTPPPARRALLVNIDFAFGQQAEEIMANLVLLFGRNLASVSVLGKAGGLRGARGDLLLPTGFIDQVTDFIHVLPAPQALDLQRLRRRVPGRGLHQGPLLTAVGTLLQNRTLLNFYRRLWRCVGLEMEGFYYYRHIRKATQLGVIPAGLPLRFLYYVSDLPLEAGVSLSEPLRASEGIPPLYAITREILSSIFEQEAAQ